MLSERHGSPKVRASIDPGVEWMKDDGQAVSRRMA
jgi:hypothetical protein